MRFPSRSTEKEYPAPLDVTPEAKRRGGGFEVAVPEDELGMKHPVAIQKLRSRSVRRNAYYDVDGSVAAENQTPLDRRP